MAQQLTEIELRRYSRQIKLEEIGIEGQEKLKNSKVLVIGTGGLGTPVLQYLAAAGVGTIGICDNDYVNESNFHRQIMYGASDLGKLKTIVAKEKLKLLNPLIEYNIHNIFVNEDNAEAILKNYHIIVDCSGNAKSSKILIEFCKRLNLKMVIGNVSKYIGKVFIYDPIIEISVPQNFFADQLQPDENQDKGIIGVIPGIIGSIQATETLKLLLNIGRPIFGKMLTFDALNMVVIKK